MELGEKTPESIYVTAQQVQTAAAAAALEGSEDVPSARPELSTQETSIDSVVETVAATYEVEHYDTEATGLAAAGTEKEETGATKKRRRGPVSY
eukprot:m.121984 g.121984  ORF g.121984 m.121984 type:complete len:94 (+) comp13714_c0_seq1:74-355(+)